jgi:hypothetical protein
MTARSQTVTIWTAVAASCTCILLVAALFMWTSSTTSRLDKIEHGDTAAARRALFRQCQRQKLQNAEIHWQLSPERIKPALQQLHLPARAVRERLAGARVERARLERSLPLLDCAANLRGQAPMPLSPAAQRAYIRQYVAGRLNPVTGLPNK